MAKLPQAIRKTFKANKIRVGYRTKKVYSKTVFRDVDYNILEYYGIIRRYIQWKFNLSIADLESLYYLYPKSFFTKAQFMEFPRSWDNHRIKKFIEADLIVSMFPNRKRNNVYKLSAKSRHIVALAHQLLSGEKKMPVNPQLNPCFNHKAIYSQMRYRDIMKDMREAVGQKFDYKAEVEVDEIIEED